MNVEARLEKIKNVQVELLESFIRNELSPQEGMTVLTALIVQTYIELSENNSRETFLGFMGRSYDACALLKAEPEGTLQ